jgi:dTDP-glucose pyrophosphorylase
MVNILIPMSGRGSRFENSGNYTFPKPLIEVNNKPMIQVVVDNLNITGNYIFLVLSEHYEKYALKYLLPLICGKNSCKIVIVDKVTEGAACSALLASKLIDNEEELIIANSDQYIDWAEEHFLNFVRNRNADGAILTFTATHPKWSFVKINEDTGLINEVAEKKPISQNASVGIYYWKNGSDFINSAKEMIKQNIRVNNEFYIAPTYNILINSNKKIYNYPVAEMHGLGTPEDLNRFLQLGIKV